MSIDLACIKVLFCLIVFERWHRESTNFFFGGGWGRTHRFNAMFVASWHYGRLKSKRKRPLFCSDSSELDVPEPNWRSGALRLQDYAWW